MNKYNYTCLSIPCPVRQHIEESANTFKEQENVVVECPICHKPMKLMGEIHSGGYAKFASMSSEQKRQVISKRSKEHYAKKGENIVERKRLAAKISIARDIENRRTKNEGNN